MLIEAKIEGRADYTRVGSETGPTSAFDYSVTGPHILIHDIQFADVDPSMLSELEAAADALKGKEFVLSAVRAEATKRLMPAYQQRGYLKAEIGDPEAKVVKSDPQETSVDVVFRPAPGSPYKLASLIFSGNKVFHTSDLQKLIHAQVGQPLN